MYKLLFTLLIIPASLSAQTVTTIAGTGTGAFSGDNGPAAAAQLQRPTSLTFDKNGNMYIADANNFRVRKISVSGIITTFAGNGVDAFSGDGGPATAAEVAPTSVATDSAGNVYITEPTRIRKVNSAGIITTIAGYGSFGYNGDGMQATIAKLYYPYLGFIDEAGSVYFSDYNNHRIRKITTAGIISTVYGTGTSGSAGDNGPATAADLMTPYFLSRNAKGEIFFTDNGARRIRKIDTAGIITAFAGTGGGGNGGDGGPATSATVGQGSNVSCDDSGNVYISCGSSNTVRKVNTSGIITTVAGNGSPGFAGDGGPALLAEFATANFVSYNKHSLYIADLYNNRIRKVRLDALAVTDAAQEPTNIHLFPNPAHNELNITAGTTINKIVVLSTTGQVVRSVDKTSAPAKEINFSTRDLAAGYYAVWVNGEFGGKFLKE